MGKQQVEWERDMGTAQGHGTGETKEGLPAAVLVDLENLVGLRSERGYRPCRMVRRMWSVVNELVRPVWSVAACHHRLAGEVVGVAHGYGLRVYAGEVGPNRADRELVDRATTDLPAGIEAVVLVSGDGDFVPLVWQQQSLGRHVVVISRAGRLSKQLALTADTVRVLDEVDLAA